MWKIKEVKQRGKKLLKNNLWTLIFVGIFMGFIIGEYTVTRDGFSNIKSLRNVIADIKSFDEVELVKKVVHAVTDVYLDSWNDNSMDKYLEELKAVKEEIENINDESAASGKLELSFVGKNGEKIVRYYEHVSEGTGTILKNMISDNLEDFSDLSVNDKVAILLEMIEKQLS